MNHIKKDFPYENDRRFYISLIGWHIIKGRPSFTFCVCYIGWDIGDVSWKGALFSIDRAWTEWHIDVFWTSQFIRMIKKHFSVNTENYPMDKVWKTDT